MVAPQEQPLNINNNILKRLKNMKLNIINKVKLNYHTTLHVMSHTSYLQTKLYPFKF